MNYTRSAREIFEAFESAAEAGDERPELTEAEWDVYYTHCCQCYGEKDGNMQCSSHCESS